MGAQASLADLQSARLSAQGELAINYFNIRQADVVLGLQRETIAGYESTLRIARNRYNAGIVARTDVLQAETQLANARAELLGLERTRANLEHAIAVLVGQAPASFALAPRAGSEGYVPDIPFDVPSTLLQRRPDIAAAERRAAQANEQIGVAQSAFYPSLRLSANVGSGAARIGDLFSASAITWSLGSSIAQSIFSGGANTARLEGARAGFEEAAAGYRQAVLSAFVDDSHDASGSRVEPGMTAVPRG